MTAGALATTENEPPPKAGRREGRTRDPEQRPAHDEHLGAHRERGEQRHQPEGNRADHEHPAPADAIAEGTHCDERARNQEARRCR